MKCPSLFTWSVIIAVIASLVAIYHGDHAVEYVTKWDQAGSWMDVYNTTAELRAAFKRIDMNQYSINSLIYSSFNYAYNPSRIGLKLAKEGLKPKYPIIIIPGFVTSGLELWNGLECFKGHFRARLWTKFAMAKMFLSNRLCWMQHLALNYTTGLDPEGIRVRNAQGLDAVDFFFSGYDVWAKVILSLSDIGYDATTMAALPYDWRLSIPNLELRDGYFTMLRSQVELFNKIYDQKVLIVAHSWGDNVARNFLYWMEDTQPGWVDQHVAVHFNVGGPVLGVPKALTSLLSGELKETAQLMGIASVIGEQLLGKEERTLVWRTWGSALGMLPVGGRRIWGSADSAPDDPYANLTSGASLGSMLSVLEYSEGNSEPVERRLDAEAAIGELLKDAGPMFHHHIKLWSSVTVPEGTAAMLQRSFGEDLPAEVANATDASTSPAAAQAAQCSTPCRLVPQHAQRNSVPVYDPTTTPLPNAPNMRLYCSYGHDIKTERAYHYKHHPVQCDEDQCPDGNLVQRLDSEQVSAGKTWHISQDSDESRSLDNGVVNADGDGTVPLVSLGYMCSGPWKRKELNPSGVKVVTREIKDDSKITLADPRGGPKASSHVEVLGNEAFLQDLLYAAAGRHDKIDEDNIQSHIRDIVQRVDKQG